MANPPAADPAAVDPRVALLKLLPAGSKLDDLRPSPIAGIYEFTQGAEISYLTADGKYFIDGNLYDMKSRDNLTEALRTHARIALIDAVPESQMLIFSPPNPKYTITVFTDVDCAYCRKLHSQMAELNRLGIRVRYMFFPRTGPGTESWKKAEVVWCSPNRNEALTRAKAGATLDMNKVCAPTPVKREYELGRKYRRTRHAGDLHRTRRLYFRLHGAARAARSAERVAGGEALRRGRALKKRYHSVTRSSGARYILSLGATENAL